MAADNSPAVPCGKPSRMCGRADACLNAAARLFKVVGDCPEAAMTTIRDDIRRDGIPLARLESEHLTVDVAPGVGGRIVSIRGRDGHEFLWTNPRLSLRCCPPGTPYDPNFFGGVDELLPNDLPETIDGLACPDHGELWTAALHARVEGRQLVLSGELPVCGLRYERRMRLAEGQPLIELDYRIQNGAGLPRHFLWKLHAAVNIRPGDRIQCPAARARVVDLAWSRWHSLEPFPWPHVEGGRADIIPPPGAEVDFFYLYDLSAGRLRWLDAEGRLEFAYHFDTAVFPYAWLFASYGGFDGHYTAILEPCTAMPISVPEAAALGQCSRLEPGQSLSTHVSIYAGPRRDSEEKDHD